MKAKNTILRIRFTEIEFKNYIELQSFIPITIQVQFFGIGGFTDVKIRPMELGKSTARFTLAEDCEIGGEEEEIFIEKIIPDGQFWKIRGTHEHHKFPGGEEPGRMDS